MLLWEAGPPFEEWALVEVSGGLLLVQTKEVSNAQFRAFVRSAKGAFGGPPLWQDRVTLNNSYPVVRVDWQSARAYARWRAEVLASTAAAAAKPRLPTRKEWEAAAVGTAADTADSATPLRGSRPCGGNPLDRSAKGVFDLGGNVAEWSEEASTENDPSGGPQRRLVLGGSWADPPALRNSSTWGIAAPHITTSTIGFRLVWWIDPPDSVSDLEPVPGSAK
jgi:formylglycine-generating enzyme required for sulfatase activity